MTGEIPPGPTPSQKYILYALEQEGPMTTDEVAKETCLPKQSVQTYLWQLSSQYDHVVKLPGTEDGRRVLWKTSNTD